MATAIAFGQERVSFYENGVVSLNLPPVGNVLGTRATRTTHPQTLRRFQDLFSQIFGRPLRVDNPFFWRTKTDVVQTIARLGMADQIAHTRSCADVHNQTKQHPHCGLCSQCIDRRFAILAAGLTEHDPAEAYRVDLMTGARARVQDKEAALSYVRSAFGYETVNVDALVTRFPAVLHAVNILDEPPETALNRIVDLLKRHGNSVAGVMRHELAKQTAVKPRKDCLPALYGDLQRQQSFAPIQEGAKIAVKAQETYVLLIDEQRKQVLINANIKIKGTSFNLLSVLALAFLKAAGKGLDPLDYPVISAGQLAKRMQLESTETVRQNVSRTRTHLVKKFASAGYDENDAKDLIENIPWQGYRLNPDMVQVRAASKD